MGARVLYILTAFRLMFCFSRIATNYLSCNLLGRASEEACGGLGRLSGYVDRLKNYTVDHP